eukprot:1181657-Prorocentrum_minimum.AAC.3
MSSTVSLRVVPARTILRNASSCQQRRLSRKLGSKSILKRNARIRTLGALSVEKDEDTELEEFISRDLPEHVMIVPDFLENADELRALYDKRFKDPRDTTPERFIWDYWWVPVETLYLYATWLSC